MLKPIRLILKNSVSLRVYLFGGVFLVLVLALLPVNVSASSNIVNSTSTNSRGSITHNIYGGCLFRDYSMNNTTVGLGNLYDGVHNCGYRYINNHISWYDSGLVGSSVSSFEDGHVFNSTYESRGGYNILNSWADAPSDIKIRTHNVLHDIKIYLTDKSANPQPKIKTPLRNGLALFVYKFDGGSVAGTNVELSMIDSNLGLLDKNGNTISSSRDIVDEITSGSIYICGGVNLNDYVPSDIIDNLGNANDSCYIISWVPTSTEYSINANLLTYVPARGIDYSWSTSYAPIDTIGQDQPAILNLDGYFNFITYGDPYSISYWSENGLKPTNQYFTFDICGDVEECDSWATLRSNTINARKNSFNAPFGPDSATSWWSVFNFNFLFPFASLFDFSSSQCVDVPTFAMLLHSPTSQYCNWWPAPLRIIFTPVFMLFPSIILFGFVFRWLNGSSGDTVIINKGGKQ